MKRCTWVVALALIALAALATSAFGAPAAPFEANSECLECHAVGAAGALTEVDFGASVDLASCNACHWANPTTFTYGFDHRHIFANPGALCADCHDSVNWAETAWVGQYLAPSGGRFASAASLALPPAEIHRIHAGEGPVTNTGEFDDWYCDSCHGKASCGSCHGSAVAHTGHTDGSTVTSFSPAPMTGAVGVSNIPDARNQMNVVTQTITCVASACHPSAAVSAGSSATVPSCGSCHPTKTQTHGYETTDHVADDGTVEGIACSACHALDLKTEHDKASSSSTGRDCATCHPDPRDSVDAWNQSCVTAGCHTVGSTAPFHASTSTAHDIVPAGAACVECHEGSDLGTLHANAEDASGNISCLVCHSATAAPASGDCTVCHFTMNAHYGTTTHQSVWSLSNCDAAGCHSSRDLMTVHNDHRSTSEGEFACAGCHKSTDPAVVAAIRDGLTGCDSCHAGVSESQGHRSVHWADPVLQDASGPNYSYYTGSMGMQPTGDCAGCHVSNVVDEHMGIFDAETGNAIRLPRQDGTGAALTCASCHDSTDIGVRTAILSGETRCDACHVTHGPIQAVHASDFMVEPPVACNGAGCHSTSLVVEHNGGYSTTTPSGTQLTGCDVCHSYFEGSRGATIQAAIDVTNDVRCGACHAGLMEAHPDAGSHSATDAASAACGACHAKGQTAIDIKAVHADAAAGACAVCHSNPARVPDITAKTGACASCHSAEGTDYHRGLPGKHEYSAMPSTCQSASCHSSNMLPGAHQAYVDATPADETTCEVCHDNPDPGRIPAGATAACETCHAPIHPNMDHSADLSQACIDCHETGDVTQLHKKSDGSTDCDVCHSNPTRVPVLPATVDCVNCHPAVSPADPNHYPSAPHAAADGAEYQYACSTCHELGMKPEHAKASSGAVTCVECHEQKVDAFSGGWDKSCTACHTVRHDRFSAAHVSSDTACGGSDCHSITNLAGIHIDASVTVAGTTYTKCRVCHQSATAVPSTTSCVTCHGSGVHPPLDPAHRPVASQACVDCHETNDVRDLHPTCVTCHDGRALPATADCVNCHGDVSPVDPNHYPATPHQTTDASQYGYACSTCHKLGMKPEHVKASSGTVSCVECHEQKVDQLASPWNKTCAACHGTQHGRYTADHASTTTACAGSDCHAITDVTALHTGASVTLNGTTYTGCRVCHKNSDTVPTSTACTSCHDGHGDLTVIHTTVASSACVACHETGDVRPVHDSCDTCHDGRTLPVKPDCVNCHADRSPVDTEHYPTASHLAAETGCTNCHYLDMKQEHARPTAGPVSCQTCHETKVDQFTTTWNKTCAACHTSRHGAQNAKHVSPTTGCGGTGCHNVADASDIHKGVQGGGCQVCHKSPTQPATSTACGTSGCHEGVTGNHEAQHDTAGVIDPGCKGCHYTYLTTEHSKLGYTCATCHASSNTAVKAAIAGGNRDCDACHPAVNGRDRHANQKTTEFVAGNQSGHRVYDSLPGMRSSFKIGTTTYTWSLPSTSSFLKTGWTPTSVVTCDKCHTFSSSAAGPHGSAVTVNIDPAYPSAYKTARLGSTNSTIICSKCHTSYSNMNGVHGESDHDGEYCIACHTKIPHGWRLPRLLAYTSDPSTYASTRLTGLRLANHTSSNWSESDCSASCSDHSSSMSGRWPSQVLSFGTLTGVVRDASNNPVSGVTIAITGDGSAISASDGRYTITGAPTGSVTVTASKTGYTTQSKTVTINANQTATLDFSMVAAPVVSNLALNKTATASSNYSSSYSAAKAVDGSTSTYWRSSSSGTQWLQVDLGSSVSVSKVVVNWNGSYYARSYRIETSTDGSNWTSRYSTTSGTSGIKTHTFSAVNARYVRVYCTSGYSSSYRVNEFEVWNQ